MMAGRKGIMKVSGIELFWAVFAISAINSPATMLYVDVNSATSTPPYTNWTIAATNIQDAIDAAVDGDQILVTNGIYQSGGRVASDQYTNRIVLNKAITLQSVNGPTITTIAGQTNSRCAYIGSNAILSGFTLRNGDVGGALCETGAIVTNCLLLANSGYVGGIEGGTIYNCTFGTNQGFFGGGAAHATVVDSVFINNFAYNGGAAYQSILLRCVLTNNYASYGGGAYECILSNCVVSRNSAGQDGGAVYRGTNYGCILKSNSTQYSTSAAAFTSVLYNCTVNGNQCGVYASKLYNCTVAENSGNVAWGCTGNNSIFYYNSRFYHDYDASFTNCCVPAIPNVGAGNFTDAPQFVDRAAGNLRLQSNSPCINSGRNSYASNMRDCDGNPRIVGGIVDVGAYEFQTPASSIPYVWLKRYGIPINEGTDSADPDGDGMSNWREWRSDTVPTNALSLLRITGVTTNKPGLRLTWQSTNTHSYWLERATNLANLPTFSLLKSNITGQSGTTTFTDTNAVGSGPFFYRVGVQE